MATYYWYTTGNTSRIKPGWKVPSWKTDGLNGPRLLVEVVFEEVRSDHYPNRPPRITNKFVCPNYPSEFCDPSDSSKTIFEVDVRGKTFEANADHYARAMGPAIDYLHHLGDRDELKEQIQREAHKYWRGGGRGNEIIVEGTVTIVGPVKNKQASLKENTVNLRNKLIKLAHDNPKLRKELLPLLKEATRPIPIPQRRVDHLLGRLHQWMSRKDPQKTPSRSDEFLESLELKTPWGDPLSVWVAFFPASSRSGEVVLGGGFGKGTVGPVVKIWFNSSVTWGVLMEPFVQKEYRTVLLHELTHALDKIKEKDSPGIADGPTSLEEVGGGETYYNDPSEVRAYMRELYERILPTVQQRMKTPLKEKWGLGKITTVALSQDTKWRRISPHLTPKNKKRLLKGIVTALKEAVAKEKISL